MKLIIDRFEEGFAVCEDDNRSMHNIERSKLPGDAKEGDVLIFKCGIYRIDRSETDERRDRIKKKMDNLWE